MVDKMKNEIIADDDSELSNADIDYINENSTDPQPDSFEYDVEPL